MPHFYAIIAQARGRAFVLTSAPVDLFARRESFTFVGETMLAMCAKARDFNVYDLERLEKLFGLLSGTSGLWRKASDGSLAYEERMPLWQYVEACRGYDDSLGLGHSSATNRIYKRADGVPFLETSYSADGSVARLASRQPMAIIQFLSFVSPHPLEPEIERLILDTAPCEFEQLKEVCPHTALYQCVESLTARGRIYAFGKLILHNGVLPSQFVPKTRRARRIFAARLRSIASKSTLEIKRVATANVLEREKKEAAGVSKAVGVSYV